MKYFYYLLLTSLFASNLNAQDSSIHILDIKDNLLLFSDKLNKGIYLLNTETQDLFLINAVNSAAYNAKISPDKKYVGFKAIIFQNDIPYQRPVIFDIKNNAIIPLFDWTEQAGIPSFSNTEISFTVGHDLYILDIELNQKRVLHLDNYVNICTLSPGGRYIALNDKNDQIYIYDLLANEKIFISDNFANYYEPEFSPDEKYLSYKSISSEIFVYNLVTKETKKIGYGESRSWDQDYLYFLKQEYNSPAELAGRIPHKYDLKSSILSKCENYDDLSNIRINSLFVTKLVFYHTNDSDNIIFSRFHNMAFNKFNDSKFLIKQNKIKIIDIDIGTKPIIRKKTSTDIFLPGFDTIYFNQVYDIRPDRWGIGSGCCGAASALMGLMYYKILPPWGAYCSSPSYHYSPYSNYLTEAYSFNGINYNIEYARSGNTNSAYVGKGIYGWIYRNSLEDTKGHMASLLQNHGLISSVDWEPSWEKAKTEINLGFPFVLLNSLTDAGHYIVWTGYVNENRTGIFNDPYGNANQSPYLRYNSIRVKYDWPGYNNGYANLKTAWCFIYMRKGAVLSFTSSKIINNPETDNSIKISYSIKNSGLTELEKNFIVKTYISNDNKFDSKDSLISTTTLRKLLINDSLTDTIIIRKGKSNITKPVYYFLKIDPDNELQNATKITSTVSFTDILVGKPDVTALYPYPNTTMTYRKPAIYAAFDTVQQIDTSLIILKINGIDVTDKILKWKYRIILYAEQEYQQDTNKVALYLKNKWGFDSTFIWYFYVNTPNKVSESNYREGYSLSSNYPNPFNPTTKIEYKLPKATHVKITIYNTLGQVINTPVDEFKYSGKYDFVFNASRLQSGVYFYKMETPDFSEVKKMLLIK